MTTEEQNTNPISVEADVTPITKQPIPKVEPAKWQTMSVTQLHEQRFFLAKRQQMALQVGMISVAQQIDQGIQFLTELINSKATDDVGLL